MDGNMEEELIQYLLSIGALEHVYDDADNNPIYRLTENAKELVPELYQEHMKDFHMASFSLWSKGLINIVFNENGEPLIGLNENSIDLEKTKDLPKNEKEALQEMLIYWEKETEE